MNKQLEEAATELRWAEDAADKAGAAVVDRGGILYGGGRARKARVRADQARAKLRYLAEQVELSDSPDSLELAAQEYRDTPSGWFGIRKGQAGDRLCEAALMRAFQ